MIQAAPTHFDFILIGASARAAAFSAIRSGLQPLCLDLFADRDLQAHAPVHKIQNTSDGLVEALQQFPPLPVVYLGGLENHPEVIARIRQSHPLWGNDEVVLRRLHERSILTEVAQLARVRLPETWNGTQSPPADGTWLLRPTQGSGGTGIHRWTTDRIESPTLSQSHRFERWIEGISYSAIFLGNPAQGDVRFVGVTRQLIGETFCGASDFQWCGNIGPIALPVDVENRIRRFGNVLKWKVGLQGLYGIDFLLDDRNEIWVTDVNPRYPGSTELLEHATGTQLLGDHCRCFSPEIPCSVWRIAHPGEFLGKAILYSPRSVTFDHSIVDARSVPVLAFPALADLPCTGTSVPAGGPICTLFASGSTPEETWNLLKQHLEKISTQLIT